MLDLNTKHKIDNMTFGDMVKIFTNCMNGVDHEYLHGEAYTYLKARFELNGGWHRYINEYCTLTYSSKRDSDVNYLCSC